MGDIDEAEGSGRIECWAAGKFEGVEMGDDFAVADTLSMNDEACVCALVSDWGVGFNGVRNGDLNGLFSGFVISTFLRFLGGDGDGRYD